ncbi:zf-HC2 domain-containing protein [Brevibacillus dissolubilis]|uniref:zf-HC2 domain-containing protein n=1 Tax=Brevibacillus dissolubilis TaxID=1844116 RepID=UPI001116574A|nr:zf-HC2 domain-containing protein [Brevibacillus dissolubilis]
MPHIDELTMMMYVDHELLPEEHQRVTAHLGECPSCQQIYALWQADQAFFQESFVQAATEELSCSLKQQTVSQIEAIAALHEHHHKAVFRRVILWLALSLTVVLLLFSLYANGANTWLSNLSTYWTHHVIWSSAFWLKHNASDLLALSLGNFYWFLFLFTCLLGGLILLNARRISGSRLYERRSDR